MWSDCVCLVLIELDFHHPAHGQDLPRIWWIGTGLAAYHLAESVENVFSCAISSYTPPIKMLQYTRDKVKAKPPKQPVLLVTIPKTPGADDLPGVVEEGQAIQATICNPHSAQCRYGPMRTQKLQHCSFCLSWIVRYGGSFQWFSCTSRTV